MKNENPITVKVTIKAPIEKVWEYWTEPEHITKWAFASDDWECSAAENNVNVGGKFNTVMAAKDGSTSFNFAGIYTIVELNKLIEYDMEDMRHVKIEFVQHDETVDVIETFDPEQENTEELQRSGWQAIMDNFKEYVENF